MSGLKGEPTLLLYYSLWKWVLSEHRKALLSDRKNRVRFKVISDANRYVNKTRFVIKVTVLTVNFQLVTVV